MTFLYRLFSNTGELLYVGIADDWPSRMKQHQRDKRWWCEVANTALLHFGTRPEAEAAERKAIKTEHPVHNVVHNKRPATVPTPTPKLVWKCDICRQPVSDGYGYVQLPYRERRRFFLEKEDHFAKSLGCLSITSIEDLRDYPSHARWQAAHSLCDNAEDGGVYWIAVERIRTFEQVLEWTAHLMGKSWFHDTNWNELLRAVLSQRADLPNCSYRNVADPLQVALPLHAMTDDTMAGLKRLLVNHPGDSPVLVRVGDRLLRLPDEFNVEASPVLARKVEGLLGPAALVNQ